MDDLGVAAAVRDHMADWSPAGDESGLHDYRTSIRDYLDGKLNPGLGADQHVVESHWSGASPDVVVDDSVGILVEPVVSEGGQGRLRTRLDRFEGEYALLVTIAVEVQDEEVWEELRERYARSSTVSTDIGFVEAPEPGESVGAESTGSDNPFASTGMARWGGHVFLVGVLALLAFGLLTLYSWANPDTYPELVEGARNAAIVIVLTVGAFTRYAWDA